MCPHLQRVQKPCTGHHWVWPPAGWQYSCQQWPNVLHIQYCHQEPHSLVWTEVQFQASSMMVEHSDFWVFSHFQSQHRRPHTILTSNLKMIIFDWYSIAIIHHVILVSVFLIEWTEEGFQPQFHWGNLKVAFILYFSCWCKYLMKVSILTNIKNS